MFSSVSVAAVTSTSSSSDLGVGRAVSFALGTTVPVQVTPASGGGQPYLTLNSGGTAEYTGSDASGNLLFSYIVAAGENAASLEVTGLSLNGASIASVGSTAFQPRVAYTVGSAPFAVTTADLNGDAAPDLLAGDAEGSTVSVLLNDGQGNFGARMSYFVGSGGPYALTTADLNGDGSPDLIAADYNGAVSVLLGDGTGGFGSLASYPAGVDPLGLTAADLNGDGRQDLVVVNATSSTVSVLLGDGQGSLGAPSSYFDGPGSRSERLAVGDVNGDGKLDVAVANNASDLVSVLLGDGQGGFGAPTSYPTGAGPYDVVAGDFNADGKVDLAVVDERDNTVSVLLNDGQGGFGARANYIVGAGDYSLAAADVNGDAALDLITSNFSAETVTVLLGDGQGAFGPQTSFAAGPGLSLFAVADLNGDGRPDLIVPNYYSSTGPGNTVSVLLNSSIAAQPLDASGVAGLPGSDTGLAVDTTPPLVAATLTRDTGPSATDRVTSDPTLTGSGDPGATVTLTRGGATLGTITADPTGAWSFTPALADGPHTVVASETDAAGNTGTVTLSFALDTASPAAPARPLLDPTSDSDVGGDGVTSVTLPTLTGVAAAGDAVTLYDGGAAIGTATAGSDGAWSITVVSPLSEGPHGLAATAADPAGNTSPASAALMLTIDTVAPAPPTAPTLAAAADSGTAGDGCTNVVRPTLQGMAEAGSTVTLRDGAAVLGTAVADAAGAYAFTPAAALAEGLHVLMATATDAAGNAAMSASFALVIDTAVPTVSTPALLTASDSGTAGDGRTNVVRPTLTGTAEAGSTVTLRDGAVAFGTAVAGAGGAYAVISASPLSDGPYLITAIATDVAGNTSVASAPLAFIIDTTAPAASIPFLAAASDSGLPGDARTNVARPTLTGTAEVGSTVALFDGAAVLGATVADAAGAYAFVPAAALADGSHFLAAVATDGAGNASARSGTLLLEVDTAAPAVSPPALTAASDSGIKGDGRTNVTRPTLTGTAEAGSTVTLRDGAAVLGTTTVDADSAYRFVPATDLADGPHLVTATATDAAGNASAPSVPLAFAVDTAPPAAPGALALAPTSDTGVQGDGLTSVTRLTVTGTAESGSTVALLDGAALIGTAAVDAATGAWSITVANPLLEGQRFLTARATDAAGNLSNASAALALVLDTTAPSVTAALARDDGAPGDGRTSDPALAGTGTPGAVVVLREGGLLLGSTTVDATGAWRFTPTGLGDGPHTATASEADAAGNTGSASVAFVLDSPLPTTDYTVLDASGAAMDGVLSPYQGSVPGVQRQFVFSSTTGAIILVRADNTSVQGGTGDDAIVAQGGRNILDGGGGSNWLVGGTGQDTFVIDARGGTWSTVVGFAAGDDIVIRGLGQGSSTFQWAGTSGAAGYQGATLRGAADGTDQGFAVTLAGLTVEEVKRYAITVERDTDGTPALRLRPPGLAALDDAGYEITDVTTGATSAGRLDPYQGAAAGLRYQHIEVGDGPVALLARASDSLLRTGAGDDAMLVRNGDNVFDAGAGSNWLVGGAGSDTFLVEAGVGRPVWNTVVNFHAGDVLVMRGYQEGVSSWGWTTVAEGAAGYEGATLRGALDGRNVDFSLTLAGVTVEKVRNFAVTPSTAGDGVGTLSVWT